MARNRTHSNVLSGTFTSFDREAGTTTSVTPTASGTGCVATGQTLPMTMTLRAADMGGAFALGGFVQNGPSNAPTVVLLGSKNPSQAFPGMCGQIYTDLLLSLPIGVTDATGFLGELEGTTANAGGQFVFVLPNTVGGAFLTLQAHSLDAGSAMPVQVANSNGGALTVPFPNSTKVCQVTRLVSHNAGVAATSSLFYNTLSVGYALVTQLTY